MSRRGRDTILLVVAMLAAWQALYWHAGDTALAPPAATARRLEALLITAGFWSSIGQTVTALAVAMVISAIGGVALGVALALNRTASAVMEPILMALYALPKVTLYPLVLLVFGLGISAKIAFGAMHALVPIAIVTMNAILQLRPIYRRVGRAMQMDRSAIIRTIILPAIAPDLVVALRLGFSLSLLGVVIGEMFASRRGLGFEIMTAMNTDDTATLMAVAVLLSAIALSGNAVLARWELVSRRT